MNFDSNELVQQQQQQQQQPEAMDVSGSTHNVVQIVSLPSSVCRVDFSGSVFPIVLGRKPQSRTTGQTEDLLQSSPSAGVVVLSGDKTISREHAEIDVSPENVFYIRCLGKNGISLDGTKVFPPAEDPTFSKPCAHGNAAGWYAISSKPVTVGIGAHQLRVSIASEKNEGMVYNNNISNNNTNNNNNNLNFGDGSGNNFNTVDLGAGNEYLLHQMSSQGDSGNMININNLAGVDLSNLNFDAHTLQQQLAMQQLLQLQIQQQQQQLQQQQQIQQLQQQQQQQLPFHTSPTAAPVVYAVKNTTTLREPDSWVPIQNQIFPSYQRSSSSDQISHLAVNATNNNAPPGSISKRKADPSKEHLRTAFVDREATEFPLQDRHRAIWTDINAINAEFLRFPLQPLACHIEFIVTLQMRIEKLEQDSDSSDSSYHEWISQLREMSDPWNNFVANRPNLPLWGSVQQPEFNFEAPVKIPILADSFCVSTAHQ